MLSRQPLWDNSFFLPCSQPLESDRNYDFDKNILRGSTNKNNHPVHEEANIFLLFVERRKQRTREPSAIFLPYTNSSSHNKERKTSFIFGNMCIGLLKNTLNLCINILLCLTCLFWNGEKFTGIIPITWPDTARKTMPSNGKITFPLQKFTKETKAQGKIAIFIATVPLFTSQISSTPPGIPTATIPPPEVYWHHCISLHLLYRKAEC